MRQTITERLAPRIFAALIALCAAGCSSRLRSGVAPDVVNPTMLTLGGCADNDCQQPTPGADAGMDADAALALDAAMDGVSPDSVTPADADSAVADAAETGTDVVAMGTDVVAMPDVQAVDVVIPDGGMPMAFNEVFGGAPNFVELQNHGMGPFDVGDYAVAHAGTDGMPDLATALRFPHGTSVAPGDFVLIVSGPGPGGTTGSMDCVAGAGRLLSCYHSAFSVGGSGDTLYLLAPDNSVAATVAYTPSVLSTGQTYGRIPNGTGSFFPILPSPGLSNDPVVNVNEVNGTSPDYLELYNGSDGTYDLSNHVVADSSDGCCTPRLVEAVRFPAGTIIGPHEFVFVLAGQAVATNAPQTACAPSITPTCFHTVFGISSSSGEAVWLLSPRDEPLSRSFFPMGVPGGATWGRLPDGPNPEGNLRPTPGGPNRSL